MDDPLPENVEGRKVHVFEHRVDWGHVGLAVAVIVVIAFVWLQLRDRDNVEGDQEDSEDVF